MAENDVVLEILRFELKFLEDGGYGRSPRTAWRPTNIFARIHPHASTLVIHPILILATSVF